VLRETSAYLAWFVLHFVLIIAISCCDVVWLVAHKLTILPSPFSVAAEKAERIADGGVFGDKLSASNPFRRALLIYLHLAGIERGYGYFAPNVPVSYKLVFELHYSDGRVEYEVPGGNTAAANLRLAALLDEIGRTRVDALREYLVKLLARSTWREHADVKTIRAILGSRNLPSIAEFQRGTRESYEFLCAYDFSLEKESSRLESP